MKAYFISGLAADQRVFKYIQLPEGYEMVHLDWIKPEQKETLQSYSLRLAEKINREEDFVLVGLSMGGMIAAEISKAYPPHKTILISSVPASLQLPYYFKWAYQLRLHKLVPVKMVKSAAIMKRLFTSETREDKETLRQIIRESDSHFIRWAMEAILRWRSEAEPASCIHIHGTRDEILPFRFVKPTHVIERGGHLMVMNRPDEINKVLSEVLAGKNQQC